MGYRHAPSFCRQCGAPWAAPGRVCAACGAAVQAWVPSEVPDDGRNTARLFMSALALYFALLSTLLVPLAFMADFELEWVDQLLLVDSVVVLLWAALHWRDVLPRLRNVGRRSDWLYATAAVPVTLAVALGNAELVASLVGVDSIDMTTLYAASGYSVWWALLVIAVQPAIFEELAFRGVVFGAFERVMEPRTVIIVTALMFMVLHLAMLGIAFLVVMGLLLGWLRQRSGSLWPGMWLHLCHNAAIVLIDWPG